MPRLFALVLLVALGCSAPRGRGFAGEVGLVLLHTSDLHSALFPYGEVIGWADARRGLGEEGSLESAGGAARLATLVGRERALAERAVLLDSGDAFQGSLAFDRWSGEPELLTLAALGVRAQALGNHELDRGAENLRERYAELATFPLLAANYAGDPGTSLAELLSPFAVLDVRGLRLGVIGVANVRSVPALNERPNALGVTALDTPGAVQGAIDALRPVVDVIVVLTHLGLDADRALVRETSGIDVVLGGHQHLALDEPVAAFDCGGSGEGTIRDAEGRTRRCTARRVLVVHSGAYGKYLGKLALRLDDDPARLDAAYEPLDAHEVTDAAFELVPVHARVPEEPAVRALLEPYRDTKLERSGLAGAVGYAPRKLARVGVTGGDSPLGNVAANAARALANAELAVLGASSLRRDLAPGPFDAGALERSFPFDDPVLRVRVLGRELAAAFERAARTAGERDCRTPVHVAGAVVRLRCPCDGPPCARVFVEVTEVCCRSDVECAPVAGACSAAFGELGWCLLPLEPEQPYELATTAYLADGNGGYFERFLPSERALAGAGLREAVTEMLHGAEPCAGAPPEFRRLPCLDERSGARRDGRLRIEP